MAKYRIKSGRYCRFENGRRVEYKPGVNDTVELTDAEAAKLKNLIEVIPEVVAPKPQAKPVEPPKVHRAAVPWGEDKATTRYDPTKKG